MLWGIDLGGTKIEAVVLDEKYAVVERMRIATEAERGMGHIISQIVRLLDWASERVGSAPNRIGVGTPGAMDPKTGLLLGSNTQAINGQPFYQELRRVLDIPLAMANDANCFALAEAKMGAVKESEPDARVVFGVIMGTGVGGGIVIDGRVLPGRHGSAGEWGHSYLDASGGECYCGAVGCVERILSGPALEDFYAQLSGSKLGLPTIASRAQAGTDEFAGQTIERLIKFFGLGLSNVVNILDPDVIVLGGGLSNLDLLYDQGLASLRQNVFNPSFDTKVLRPKLGDSAGVFGAALLDFPPEE